jgi:hypothetical protein
MGGRIATTVVAPLPYFYTSRTALEAASPKLAKILFGEKIFSPPRIDFLPRL